MRKCRIPMRSREEPQMPSSGLSMSGLLFTGAWLFHASIVRSYVSSSNANLELVSPGLGFAMRGHITSCGKSEYIMHVLAQVECLQTCFLQLHMSAQEQASAICLTVGSPDAMFFTLAFAVRVYKDEHTISLKKITAVFVECLQLLRQDLQ